MTIRLIRQEMVESNRAEIKSSACEKLSSHDTTGYTEFSTVSTAVDARFNQSDYFPVLA